MNAPVPSRQLWLGTCPLTLRDVIVRLGGILFTGSSVSKLLGMTELTADMGEDQPNTMLSTYQRARLRLVVAGLVCFALFWFAGATFRIPVHPRYEASLLLQSGTVMDLIVIAVLLPVGVCVGSLIAGTIRFDAGLFAATLGLSALSLRGGPMRYVLQGAATPSIYLVLVTELILLYALIALAWWLQVMF